MNDIDQYIALLSKWKNAYTSAIYSFVGLKTGEGIRILSARIHFGNGKSVGNRAPLKFETEHIIAERLEKDISPDEVFATINRVAEKGEINSFSVVPALPPDCGRFSSYLKQVEYPFTAALLFRGESWHNLLNRVGVSRHFDLELKTAEAPFDTIDELLIHFGLSPLKQLGDMTILELVAGSPGMINRNSTIFNKGAAAIDCQFTKTADVEKVRLGYRIFQADQKVQRGSLTGRDIKWQEAGPFNTGTYQVCAGAAVSLQMYLSYDGILIDQLLIDDPNKQTNPRNRIHQLIDDRARLLREKLLTPEKDKDKSTVFEFAVSTLLTLLGFSVVNYGRIPKLQDGPDIIAFTPLGHIAIVECTTGLINQKDKLAKLVQRAHLIRETLAGSEFSSVDIQTVIATPISREAAKAEFPIAEQNGIAVICREELEAFLNQIYMPLDADGVFKSFRKSVPVSDKFPWHGLG